MPPASSRRCWVSATGWSGHVTRDRRPLTGPLGRRLLAAFVLVALSSVAVLTVAALIGTDRGLTSAHRSERQQAAGRVAAAAGTAYTDANGWAGADLSTASAIADAAVARLVVRDTAGSTVWPGRGMGPGMGGMHPDGGGVVDAPVVVGGQRVGTVRLSFATAATGGRTVAWSWVIGAALVALAAALAVSGYVSRRMTRPLLALAAAARRFAADVAHELRTPLAALQAGLEELRDGLRNPDTPRLAALHDQTLRLGRVVQDLADLSAAESAALSLRPADTDLAEVAHAALAAQRPQLDAAGLRLDADLATPVPVRADPDRIHQAIGNLLANAVRYCRPGDRVTVRAHPEDGSAVLTVADTGPGIPADDLPHVFDRPWRGQDARSVAGSGIGLAVVRELVTAHGGTVTAQSPPGGGTTVTIRLPGPAAGTGPAAP